MPEAPSPAPATTTSAAAAELGLERLRPGQREAIEAAAAGRDVLAVLPTGWGKSAIYQVAALMVPGPTIVVSPLLALQRDQVQGLEGATDAGAVAISSAISDAKRRKALQQVRAGAIEFAFVSPEQLANDEVLAALRGAAPSLFVVDEAHCVSEWGHDFRPAYLRLGVALRELGRPPAIALTATAPRPVQDEIAQHLGLVDPLVVVRGYDRPNLFLEVERAVDPAEKRARVLAALERSGTPAIVYAATKRDTEELAAAIAETGVRVAPYHAGLATAPRTSTQDAFMAGDLDVVVATNAFGMGVDKADVRAVVHHDPPGSLEAYYQEVGRAGRDGEPSTVTLVHRQADFGLRRYQAGSGAPPAADVDAVLEALAGGPLRRPALKAACGLGPARLARALNELEAVGAVRRAARGASALATPVDDAGRQAIADALAERAERRSAVQRSRVEMVRAYLDASGCRRTFLLGYLGEQHEGACGRCDRCEAAAAIDVALGPHEELPVTAPDDGGFATGDLVEHEAFGPGEVLAVDAEVLTIVFEGSGYRQLDRSVVADAGLLSRR